VNKGDSYGLLTPRQPRFGLTAAKMPCFVQRALSLPP
jgi:hypothetical protein